VRNSIVSKTHLPMSTKRTLNAEMWKMIYWKSLDKIRFGRRN
jgi:hypothetical protein